MNLPNLLTLIRFVLIPIYLVLFFMDERYTAFGILLLAGCTDVLDGYIARKYNQVTMLGAMLDPLADKLMMITVIISLLWGGHLPWSAAIAVFIRDAGMIVGSALFHFRGKKTVPANWMGKLTTALFYLAILFVYFAWPYHLELLWVVIAFSFITAIIYTTHFFRLNRSVGAS
ncbi:CDP-alcohol phosphatidyltransferase family protein [Paenibacillus sp. 481]|uniref:CDP-alcohol phosphatidyltransferase family protein n=1 Tax=Paenibacillus sp. 481 TaxID=2835869 RepID=UPI001E5B7101|nr:CDP-alcohol phosphatidyltransferase family protein [Paenibacillus sp. 481]UHA75686.1 CDP-alcohol phosphatidyltransferase family protein [Paenibacillus sp. 481]